jgi:hypothetical protein
MITKILYPKEYSNNKKAPHKMLPSLATIASNAIRTGG